MVFYFYNYLILMSSYYDRYKSFTNNNEVSVIPFIKITKSDTDILIRYNQGQTRFDRLSLRYYGSPYYGWLINLANPEYGQLEFDISDDSIIRIPLPLERALSEYEDGIKNYQNL
jgi:hypothetical protein